MKKANLSINTIIIAALALVVLIILIAIFSGKASIFRQNTMPTCQDKGGYCLEGQDAVCEDARPIRMITRGCSPDNGGAGKPEQRGVCCLPVGAS